MDATLTMTVLNQAFGDEEVVSLLKFVNRESDLMLIDQDQDVDVITFPNGTLGFRFLTDGPLSIMVRIVSAVAKDDLVSFSIGNVD